MERAAGARCFEPPAAHLIDLSRTGHGSQGEVVKANIPLDGGGPLTYQRGMAVVDDRSGYGPTTLFLLGHSGTQAQLRALSVAAFHADNNTPSWHTLETVTATPAILKGRLQPSPDGQRLAYARTTGSGMGLLQWGGNELRVLSLDPGRLALSGAPLTVTGPTGRITGLDFSPAADYLYFTVSGLSYPTTQRLYRLPLAGGAIAPVAWHVTDVRRNAQQGGTHMLCTTTSGLRRIAQPDDASPTQTTHALPGIQPALALQPVLIGPDRSTSTRHLGRRRYELTDHLGNVRAVVGDRKLSDFSLDINTPVLVPTSFKAQVLSYADYDPFGSLLPGRNYNSGSYRNLFQGQEHDDELYGSVGTSYAFEYRMHDPRVGRFLSIDPLAAKYPHNSPYAFSENRVLDGIELEGLEWQPLDGDGNNVAPGSDNITSYSWAGYSETAYSYDGAYHQNAPTDPCTEYCMVGIAAPAGTVAEANLRTGTNSMTRYTSDQENIYNGNVQSATLSQANIDAIGTLDGRLQEGARLLFLRSELELGTPLRMTQAVRTFDQQNALYAQGRTAPGARVTNARGGQSPHNYGMAFDVARQTDATHRDAYGLDWNALGRLGTSLGMDWGGNWRTIQDRPHFEVPNWRQLVRQPTSFNQLLLFPEH